MSPLTVEFPDDHDDPKSPEEALLAAIPDHFRVNVIGLILGFVGAMICAGIFTLHQSHAVSMLIGLMFILVAKVRMISFGINFPTPTVPALVVWSYLLVGYGIFATVAILHAIIVLA